MSLRRKAVLASVLTFLLLMGLLHLLSWVFIMGGYRGLERKEAEENAARALDAVRSEVDDLSRTTRDWAVWDDTYAFMEDRSREYVEANLNEGSLVGIRVQAVAFLDVEGGIVQAKGMDLVRERETPLPTGLLAHLSPGSPLLQPASTGEGVSGLLMTLDGPFLVSSQPILTSRGVGPPRGALVMGRLLDEEEMARIIAPFRLDVELGAAGLKTDDADWLQAESRLLGGEEFPVQVQGSNHLHAYGLLQDIRGNPALILRVNMERTIHREGLRTFFYYMAFLAMSSLVIFAMIFLLLERTFLRRVSRLDREIAAIGDAGDPSLRVAASGKDEIASLSRSINGMLDRLEGEERRFRSLIENSLDLILILDAEGRVTYQSPSVARVLGYSERELAESDIFEFVHPGDRNRARDVFLRSREHPGSRGHHEVRFRHRDGNWLQLEVTGYNLLRDPAVGGVVINARDISERSRARARLETLNRLFTSLGPDVIANIERIILAAREILEADHISYAREERGRLSILFTTPHGVDFRVHENPAGCFLHHLIEEGVRETVFHGGEALQVRCRDCAFSLYDKYSSCASHPVVSMGRTMGFLSVFSREERVLSDAEAEMLGTLARALAVEEERLSREQGLKDFIDIASHELRHPITLMKGYAITLLDYEDMMSREAKRDILETISAGADRLDMLLRELLDVSRIERGRFPLNRRNTDVGPLIENAVREMEGKGFAGRFRISVPPGLSPRRIDPERITRLLIILLDNAVNFSPDGSPVEISAAERSGELWVSVMDRGPGVPEKDRERIFERFYQVDEVLHHSKPGMGLGLYIAREIVEAHGGRIWYEPRPGGGSTFRFTLR
ncbi:MAG: PAS domain S-box protein [Actinobacteria bacterium]|nr:PAS domain S-box protein [Actinomycetota bacterium]